MDKISAHTNIHLAHCNIHILPVLRRLHWLPMKQRVIYKLTTASTRRSTVKPRRTWWTTVSRLLSPDAASFAPRTSTSSLSREHYTRLGDRSFPVAAIMRDREYETVRQRHCDSLTLITAILNVY